MALTMNSQANPSVDLPAGAVKGARRQPPWLAPGSKRRKHWLLLVSAGVLILLAAAMSLFFGGGDGSHLGAGAFTGAAMDWQQVKKQNFDVIVTASGDLQAGNQVEVRNGVKGRVTIIDLAEEGSLVRQGDLLMKLADEEIIEKLERAKLDVAESSAERLAAEKSLAIKIAKADIAQRAAEVKLQLAGLELEKWRQGDLIQRRSELALELEKAQRNLVRAERDLERSIKLFEEKFISKNDLDDDEIAVIETKAALETAKLNEEVFEAYEYPKEMRKYESDREQAGAELKTIIAENERELEKGRSDLNARSQQLAIYEDRLRDLEQQLAATVILAPTDGMIVYGSTVRHGRGGDDDRIVKGATVYFNQTLVVLPDTSKMAASLLVHEAMIASVKVDDPVTLEVDALQGKSLQGKVIKVDQSAEDGGWWNRNLRQYRVRVALNGDNLKTLKPAMRCIGKIVTDRVTEALTVSVQAVHTDGKQRYCYVPARSGKVRKQVVEIGRASETMVEVTAGLKENDRVLLRRPRPGEIIANG